MCQEKRLLKIDDVLEIVGVSKECPLRDDREGSVSPPRSHQSEGGEMAPTRYRRMAGLPAAGNRGELALMKCLNGQGHQPADPESGELPCRHSG